MVMRRGSGTWERQQIFRPTSKRTFRED